MIKELVSDEELQVGDVIVMKHPLVTHKYSVVRVTKNYAFVRINSVVEGKFPRIFDYRFQMLPRQKWNTTTYKIYRTIDETKT